MSMIDYNNENYYFGGIQELPIGNPSIFPLSQEDIDKIVEENGGSGTGGKIDPEQKEVTYTENGVNIIEPSGDFEGLSSVKVTVGVPGKTIKEDTVELSATENGIVETSASEFGVDGLKAVSVSVNVPQKTVKDDAVELSTTENGTVEVSAADYNVDGLKTVNVAVNVPIPSIKQDAIGLNVTENGEYSATASEYSVDGLKTVNVSVDVPQKTVKDEAVTASTTENGTIDVLAADYDVDGLKAVSVTVNVPIPTIKQEAVSLNVTENGEYSVVASGYSVDGLKTVNVSVNVPAPNTTSKFYYSNEYMTETDDTTISHTSYRTDYDIELVSAYIGNGVTIIENDAFGNPMLTSVTIDSDAIVNKNYGHVSLIDVLGYQVEECVIGDSVSRIGNEVFRADPYLEDAPLLNSVIIGSGVTSIGSSAFSNCKNLEFVTIGESVRSIGDLAFNETNLSTIDIPNSITSIGSFAFSGCTNLMSVTIPSSVTRIGNFAFDSVEEVWMGSTNPISLSNEYGDIIYAFGDLEEDPGSGSGSGDGGGSTPARALTIFVPDEAFNAYYNSTDPGWIYYKDHLQPYI